MGRHKAKIVGKEQHGDGSIAIRVRCCGSDQGEHDSVHTHYDIGKKTKEEIHAWAKDCLAKKEEHCEAMRTAHRALDVLIEAGL